MQTAREREEARFEHDVAALTAAFRMVRDRDDTATERTGRHERAVGELHRIDGDETERIVGARPTGIDIIFERDNDPHAGRLPVVPDTERGDERQNGDCERPAAPYPPRH